MLLGAFGGFGALAGFMDFGGPGAAGQGSGGVQERGSFGRAGQDGGTGGVGPGGSTAMRGGSGGPGGATAMPGDAGAPTRGGVGAEAESRRLPRSGAPKAAATPGGTGGAEPGMVAGTTAAEDVLAGGPDPRDGEDFKADGPSRHTDQQAVRYFRAHWGPDDKALKRLRDVRTVGGYLRIYTDLPESADNSLTAITLCERGLDYLHSRGIAEPVVFVQAEFGGNGNPVLANILGSFDRSCKVTHPAPG